MTSGPAVVTSAVEIKPLPSDVLAEFAASVPSGSIPDDTLTCVEECILDFVGNVAYGGCMSESSEAFRTGARNLDPNGAGYTVVGERGSYSRSQAAFLNGAFAHSMDFDDTNHYGIMHPAAPIVPAAMVCAEERTVSGRALVEAVAVGYEVACRIGGALGTSAYERGFHNTAVAGIFGAVAAAGRLRGCTAHQIAAAFGIAGSLAAGSLQCLEDGSWNKRLHPGFAASNALIALAFAEAGVVAAADPLTGRYGLLTGYTNASKPELMTRQLRERWVAGETAIKPYPSCRFNHSAIDAVLTLRERFTPEQRATASLNVIISQKAYDLVGEPQPHKLAPKTVVDGQFSVYFQVAIAWLDGDVNIRSYLRIGAKDVEAMASRIHVTASPNGGLSESRVSVDGVEGATATVLVPSGEYVTPLGRPRIKLKFVELMSPIFGADRSGALADRLLSLRSQPGTAALIRELRQPNDASGPTKVLS